MQQLLQCWETERAGGLGATLPCFRLCKMPQMAKLVLCHEKQRGKKLLSVAARLVLNRGLAQLNQT